MHLSDRSSERRVRQASLRGADMLRTLPDGRVLWDTVELELNGRRSELGLRNVAELSQWTSVGRAALQRLGLNQRRGGFTIIEYGSSTPTSPAMEDVALLKACRVMEQHQPLGVITMPRGWCALHESLTTIENGWAVLGGRRPVLHNLFSTAELLLPADRVALPEWERVVAVLRQAGFELVLEIIYHCYQSLPASAKWTDLIAVCRYVTASFINQEYGDNVPLAIVPADDWFLFGELGDLKVSHLDQPNHRQQQKGGLVQRLAQAAGTYSSLRTPTVRVLNFPCQSDCGKWHWLNTRGEQLKQEGPVAKVCRLTDLAHLSVEAALQTGAGLSGAAIYYASALLGNTGPYVFLARDHSRGNVYRVMRGSMEQPDNLAYALPYDATNLYGFNSDPAHALDSLALLEILLRVPNGRKVIEPIMSGIALPYHYQLRQRSSIEVSLDGTVMIHRSSV